MPTFPLYAEHATAARGDDLLRWYTNQEPPRWEDGNVESPTGWFAAVLIDSTDIREYVMEFGDPWISEHRNFAPGYYMIQINSDGLVFGNFYGFPPTSPVSCRARRRMLADFNRLRRLYFEWCGPDEGDSDFHDTEGYLNVGEDEPTSVTSLTGYKAHEA